MSPYGNSFHVPYASMGSGSLSALAVLETKYREDLSEQEAIDLAAEAIEAGIKYDLGSGSNVNIFSVTREGTKKMIHYREHNLDLYKDTQLFDFKDLTKKEIISQKQYQWKDIKIEREVISTFKDNYSMMELC